MSSNVSVLIVDDSRVSRMMTRQFILNKHAQWQIIEASTGEEAIEKLNGIKPALIIMDINMPGMGGIAAAEIIRTKHPAQKIALQTANIQDAIRNRAANLNASFLEKPINETRIHKLLDDLGVG